MKTIRLTMPKIGAYCDLHTSTGEQVTGYHDGDNWITQAPVTGQVNGWSYLPKFN